MRHFRTHTHPHAINTHAWEHIHMPASSPEANKYQQKRCKGKWIAGKRKRLMKPSGKEQEERCWWRASVNHWLVSSSSATTPPTAPPEEVSLPECQGKKSMALIGSCDPVSWQFCLDKSPAHFGQYMPGSWTEWSFGGNWNAILPHPQPSAQKRHPTYHQWKLGAQCARVMAARPHEKCHRPQELNHPLPLSPSSPHQLFESPFSKRKPFASRKTLRLMKLLFDRMW